MANNSSATITVTNTYEEASVTATKEWADANNQDGKRKNVVFKLQERIGNATAWSDVSGSALKDILVLSATPASWTNLPAWKNNQFVHYRAVEVPPTESSGTDPVAYLDNKYTVSSSGFTEPTVLTDESARTYLFEGIITNSHELAKKSVTFTKHWDHKGASDYLTPADLKANLHLWARVGTDEPREVSDAEATAADGDWFKTNWKAHLTVSNGYVITITDLPENKPQATEVESAQVLQYFITEDAPTNYTVSYDTGNTGANHVTGKTGEGEILTNTRKTGSLKISKQVVSDLAADFSKDFTFTITTNPKVTGTGYTYTKVPASGSSSATIGFDSDGKASISLKHGEGIQIDGLPIGVKYTVAEVQEASFATPQYSTDTTTDTSGSSCDLLLDMEGQTKKADFQNTREAGDLNISKSIVSGVQSDSNKKFKFEIEFTNLADAAKSKQYGDVTLSDAKAQFDLANNETKTLTGLPVGATYTIKEIGGNGTDEVSQDVLNKFTTSWMKTVAGSNASVNSPAGTDNKTFPGTTQNVAAITKEQSSVAFVNTRKTGKLQLTKVVSSPITSDTTAAYTFAVTLSMSNETLTTTHIAAKNAAEMSKGTVVAQNDGSVTISATVSVNDPVFITGIPIDAQYSVAEDTSFDAKNEFDIAYQNTDAGSQSSSTENASTSHTITKDASGGTYTMQVTNTRKVVPVSIRKVSATHNQEGLAGAEFTLTLDGAVEGSDWYNVPLVSTAASNGYLVKENDATLSTELYLSMGNYTLTETKAPVGYNKLSKPITFEVTEKGVENFEESVLGSASSTVGQDNGVVPLLVGNSTGVELPSTGGFGILPYYLAGILLLGCFLVLCFV
jgi:hypothetical protein